MSLRSSISIILLPIFVLIGHRTRQDSVLHVAVASNFVATMNVLVSHFEEHFDHDVVVISGSTGKHYAQITQGAPYDIFFSADEKHPRLLESRGIAIQDTRFTYAIGRIVLWSPRQHLVDSTGDVLYRLSDLRLAIANPRLAPYGKAAQEILEARKLWSDHAGKIVRGENINQAFHFVESGNADLGFVAYSQVVRQDREKRGSMWLVPQDLYEPINQQAVLLVDNEVARTFLEYVQGDEARQILRHAGYGTP